MTPVSLRVRLTLIILLPLLMIAAMIGTWQVRDAREKAVEIFDHSLQSTALAIAADIAFSDGDALSRDTQDRLVNTSGGRVFYHVYAPDGVFVTGFATPPIPTGGLPETSPETQFYNGTYHGQDVRVARFSNATVIGDYTGVFTFTVWQEVAVQAAFARDLTTRTFIVIAALTGTVGLVVWFGVNLGLRPLLDLEEAISARSSGDLRPIRRTVPVETRGLVTRLNTLFGQVETTMQAQNEFISNAAHQLRNPIAGVLAMAEAVRSAPSEQAARSRAEELLSSAQRAKDLANKLLTLERIKTVGEEHPDLPVDLNRVVAQVAETAAPSTGRQAVAITTDLSPTPATILADEVMVTEAIANLVDNALKHGGPELSRIGLKVSSGPRMVRVEVADDGIGVAPRDVPVVLSRFGQARPGEGSGLGLSIAEAVAERHGGRLDLDPGAAGLTVRLSFPARPEPSAA